MSAIAGDIRYALRSFLRAPGFTLVALITLALGIGGTTAIFSIVDGILLRPLPYPNPHLIQRIAPVSARGESTAFTPGDFLDVKRDATSFASIAAYRQDIVDLTGRGEPTRVDGMQTTAAFFDVFGIPPLLGRLYHESSDAPGAAVTVIGESLWRQHFGADPNIIGTKVRLNGAPTEIIGVASASLRHPRNSGVWMLSPLPVPTSPLPTEDLLASRSITYFAAVGRLHADVPLAQAREQLSAIGARLAKDFPDENAGESLAADPLADTLVSDVRGALFVLLGAVGFVLLIACANVAGLLIARGTSRRRELAVRTAVGAGRGRLIQQLLTESLVLAFAGGILGLVAGNWILRLLVAIAPENLPRLEEVSLDWRIGSFTFAATIVVGVIFGLTPAVHSSKPDLNVDLKDGGRSGTARTGARSILVVGEVALALVLLIGAGLMLTSLSRLQTIEPGYRTTEVVTAEMLLPLARYSEEQQRQFYTSVLERVRQNPMTAQAALMFPLPLSGSNAQAGFEVEGRPRRRPSEEVTAELNLVSPGYFQTAGLRLLRGRDFNANDGPNSPGVVIVNEATLAEFGDRDPIGSRVNLGEFITVVGVVSNARRALDTPPRPAVYVPYTQVVLPYMGLVVRTNQGVGPTANAIKATVAQFDPDLPVGDVKTIEQMITETTGQPRFRSFLVASFAALALLLAAVGVYGLISFTVAQRIPELGVRFALGANPWQVFRLVIGQGLRLAVLGVVLGLLVAAAATRFVTGLLFNTSATDPTIYISLSVVLLAMAALACYVPARRAMRVDPMTALRSE